MAQLTPGQKLRQVLGIGVLADSRHGRDRPRLHPALFVLGITALVLVAVALLR